MKLKKIVAIILALMLINIPTNVQSTDASTIQYSENDTLNSSGLIKLQTEWNPKLEGSLLSTRTKYVSVSDAANSARQYFLQHMDTFSVYVRTESNNQQKVFDKLDVEIFKETINSDEGDYMKWDIDTRQVYYNCYPKKINGTTYYDYEFRYQVEYLTTPEQRQQVDECVDDIIQSFDFNSQTTEYEKIKTIYDYVCNNVVYADNLEDKSVYTAWSALINKKAVCQGYSQLMYKMLKEVGISNRLIPGYGTNETIMHGWNIVKLGDYYYNIDATWDSQRIQSGYEYDNFLKGDNFKNHTRLEDYSTNVFYSAYPMASNDYGKSGTTISDNSKISAFSLIKPKIKSISRKKIKLSKVKGCYKYQIMYSTKKGFKKNKVIKTKKTTYKFKNLKKNNKYYVKYRAYCYINSEITYTKWSKVKKIKKDTKKKTPI